MINPDSPVEIRTLLAERGLALKKRWGQNFLINRGARERLVALLDPAREHTVWEIGPGLGSMTGLLSEKCRRVLAFEVDRGLCRYLAGNLREPTGFFPVEGDFLETWRAALAANGGPDRILGNLPYRSASLMIADLIEAGVRPPQWSLPFSVSSPIGCNPAPGTKSYSSFSVLCQCCFRVNGHGDFQPGSFYPVQVVSSIVAMKPREGAPGGETLKLLSLLLRGLFSSRRKTLRNNLGSQWLAPVFSAEEGLAALRREGVDPGARAEELEPEVFARLARAVLAARPGTPS